MSTPAVKIAFPPCRFIAMIMCCIYLIIMCAMRVILSISIVPMVNQTYANNHQIKNQSTIEAACPGDDINKNVSIIPVLNGEFNWNIELQGHILGAFFYGYLWTQFPGGMLSYAWGGKRVILVALSISSILTLLTPLTTRYLGAYALISLRILLGLAQGVSVPASFALISEWAPPWERSRFTTLILAGLPIGIAAGNSMAGFLCSFAWEYVYYFFGGLGLLWAILWIFLVFDSPAKHPRISQVEREYIEDANNSGPKHRTSLMKMPWKSIFTSAPFYAVLIAQFCFIWGYYTMLTCLPLYFAQILKFNIKNNGFLSSLPFILSWIFILFGGFMADLMISSKKVSVTFVRKLATSIGFLGHACCFVAVGYVNCNRALSVFLIILAFSFSGISYAGWSVNLLDIAPKYAGTMMGLTNTISSVAGFVTPLVVAFFTSNNQTRAAWQIIFFIAAGIYVIGFIFYLILGDAHLQTWADQHHLSDENKKNKLIYIPDSNDVIENKSDVIMPLKLTEVNNEQVILEPLNDKSS